jgi:hypothetical protein
MWVQTVVTATIEEVLKDSSSSANKGDRVLFLEDGGDIGIGPTRVHAAVPWKHFTVLGGRYLVFTERGPKGELYVLPESTYHLAGAAPGKLLRSTNDPIMQLSEEEVLATIRAHQGRP